MHIVISNQNGKPIYEQITEQIKGLIISGELREGDPLPSMRILAKELRISVITFVAGKNTEFLKEEQLRKVEEHLQEAVHAAQLCGMEKQELLDTLNLLWEE